LPPPIEADASPLAGVASPRRWLRQRLVDAPCQRGMVPAAAGEDVDYISNWATLTFEVL
jgi:hypothetical protein